MNMRDLMPWTRETARGLPASRVEASPVFDLQRDMNRLFDDFFRGFDRDFTAPALFGGGRGWPSVDVAETDTEFKVTAELPGLDENDVELTLKDNALTLSGEKRDEREEKNEGRYYAERFHGRFSRSIPLPAEVDRERVAAAFRNGVLTVILPKTQQAQDTSKRIPIQKLS